ncbi:Signal transduction histidine kinase CheA [Brevinematales bacterium NS]|nr:chemotaxis protein CheA [Brevinematales bacterium]QJR20845.1 Signal transduction histidine kinase CheA [Brevinematales bacterium NS]
MTHKDEILQLFEMETSDHLQKATNALLLLEKEPENKEYIIEIKREIHTLKGASRMMGFKNLSRVAHQIENLFETLENNQKTLSRSMISTTLEWLDWITNAVKNLPSEPELPEDFETLFQNALDGLKILPQKNILSHPQPHTEETNAQVQKSPPPSFASPEHKTSHETKKEKTDYLTIRFDRIKNLLNFSNIFTNYIGKFRYYADQLSIEFLAKQSKEEILSFLENIQNQFSYDIRFYELYTKQFQDQVSSMILVPLGGIFNTFPRLVRDVAISTGKEVNFTMEGKEIEVDKQLIEHIQNVLIHLLRNAVDHGIELPEERQKKGKPPIGNIHLKAYTQMDRIVLEISDDGRGLQTQKILEKAISKGLVSADKAKEMSPQEIWQLIFLPGFSTKENVSDFSGRGVGMDVVADTLRRFNSEITIKSEENKGTTFILSFPINSSIISVTLFESHNSLYAFPSLNIDQVLLLSEQKTSFLEEEWMLEYKHRWIPLLSIESLLGYPETQNTKENIIVISLQNKFYGIVVEKVIGEMSIVIKSLSGLSEKIRILAGVLSLSRRDVLVLNALELIEHYRQRSQKPRQKIPTPPPLVPPVS